jgi:cell division protein FtsB
VTRPARTRHEPVSLRKRILLTVALCAILALVGRSILGDRGLFEVWRKKTSFQQLTGEVQALRDQNTSLRHQIEALRHDPLAIERIAREELGYVRPGEITFVIREDNRTQAATNPELYGPGATPGHLAPGKPQAR